MQSKMGLSIQGYRRMNGTEKALLSLALNRLNSTSCTIIDDIALANEVQSLYPDMIVNLRLIPPEGDEDIQHYYPPDRWFDWISVKEVAGGWIDPRIYLNYNNEGSARNPMLIAACVEVVRKAREHGRKVVVLNSSVGTMLPNEEELAKVAPHYENALDIFYELFKAIGENQDIALLGIHEYTRGDPVSEFPWLMGNHTFIPMFCRKNNLSTPHILVDEFGFDGPNRQEFPLHGQIERFNAQGVDGEIRCADILVNALHDMFYIGADYIVGVNLYCVGEQDNNWTRYNGLTRPRFLTHLFNTAPHTEDNVDDTPGLHWFRVTGITAPLRIRFGPGLNMSIVGELQPPQNGQYDRVGVFVNSIPRTVDGYTWYEVQNEEGVTGWTADVPSLTLDGGLELADLFTPDEVDHQAWAEAILREIDNVKRLVQNYMEELGSG